MVLKQQQLGTKPHFVERVVFLNGLTRTGKFFLGNLTAALSGLEHYQYVATLEHLTYLVQLGAITQDAALQLIRLHIDDHAYNMAIGRNLNLRTSDLSSLCRSPELDLYLRRSKTTETGPLVEEYSKSRRRPCFIVHECLQSFSLFCQASFADVRMINICRHPIDLAYSWYQRRWGTRFGTDRLSFVPVVEGYKGLVPWFAAEWKEEYEQASPIDRVILSIADLTRKGDEACAQLKPQDHARVMTVTYENLVLCPKETLRIIADFLDVSVTPENLGSVMKQEKVPGEDPAKIRDKKLGTIKEIASPRLLQTIVDLGNSYETLQSETRAQTA